MNADVTMDGVLKRRDGFIRRHVLSGAHSMFGCEAGVVCVAGGTIYRVQDSVLIEVTTLTVDSPLSYFFHDRFIYYSGIGGRGRIQTDTWIA